MNLKITWLFTIIVGMVEAGKIVRVDHTKIQDPLPKELLLVPKYACNTTTEVQACDMGDSELLLFTTKATFKQAHCVCTELGLDLAHLPELKLVQAGELAWNCLGQFTQAWVSSTADDTRNCLALSIGNEAPTLPDVLWLPCEGENPFICRKQTLSS